MRDEEKFPTVRFHKCKACGNVYTGSLTGENICPKCQAPFLPDPEEGFHFQKQVFGRDVLFNITGSLYKLHELEALKLQIESSLGEDIQSIAFAFSGSAYLDSSLINLMVKSMQTLSRYNRPTYVITREPQVVESLQMLNLDKVMTLLPTLEKYRERLEG